MDLHKLGTKKCIICYKKTGKIRNDTIYFHIDPDTHDIWCWCNRCDRGYSIRDYCSYAGLSLKEFLKQDFSFKEAPPDEINKMIWPKNFIPLVGKEAEPGVEYLKSRGIDPNPDIYYDTYKEGIVFPYYYDNIYCGAQIRLLKSYVDQDGEIRKIDTVPGTRLGLVFYNWNQMPFNSIIKSVIVTEGAFNTLSIQQALSEVYPNILQNPFKCIALSGSGVTKHQIEVLQELVQNNIKVIVAPDSDKAGLKMLDKMIKNNAATHCVLTGHERLDWNDVANEMNKKDFVKWFLGSIKCLNQVPKPE